MEEIDNMITCELCFWTEAEDMEMCEECGRYYCEDCGSYGQGLCDHCDKIKDAEELVIAEELL